MSLNRPYSRPQSSQSVSVTAPNLGLLWWTTVVREAVKLKKEAFMALLAPGFPGTAEKYQKAGKAAAAEMKT